MSEKQGVDGALRSKLPDPANPGHRREEYIMLGHGVRVEAASGGKHLAGC
jgi:hypothetical protein